MAETRLLVRLILFHTECTLLIAYLCFTICTPLTPSGRATDRAKMPDPSQVHLSKIPCTSPLVTISLMLNW